MAATKEKLTAIERELRATSPNVNTKSIDVLVKSMKLKVSALVNEYETRVANIEAEIEDLKDFTPESVDSLKVKFPAGLTAETWVEKMFEKHLELKITKMELETAQELEKEYFTETEE